ncbi:MAG: hypothetical protein IAE78_32475 [Myxococcus sp.]|nr:hypothetical protein [Myxococcus sp.]
MSVRGPASLKQHSWEGSLFEWIELAQAEYFPAATLSEYQRWLSEQLAKPGNVVPFRLVSCRAPKGAEFLRSDGTVFYAADNEPLAGLWGLVAAAGRAPEPDLKALLTRGAIPGSWPPNKKPVRFTCRWGPARLGLKDRGMKIAHLLDSGRNGIPFHPDQLGRRALLTLSLVNCFPMPNRSVVEFSRNQAVAGDLAEFPEVQSLILSFMAEHLGSAEQLTPLLAAFGPGCRVSLDADWKAKAEAFRFSVRPRTQAASGTSAAGTPPPPARPAGAAPDGPRAFGPKRLVHPDLYALVAALKGWLAAHPCVERLDDRSAGSNQGAYARFNVQHLAGTDLVIPRQTLGGVWTAADYTGVFRLNGDTRVRAVRRLIEMVDSGLELDEVLEPDVTARRVMKRGPTGENPRFITNGSDDADGLYCYPA